MFTRRRLLQCAAIIAVAGASRAGFADAETLPIVFVHGDSDLAATW
jgi:nitrous oxide reductase